MTSSALTLKRHTNATARRRASRMLINGPVSINGTPVVSYQADGNDDTHLARSKTAIGDFSTLERPIANRMMTPTSWRMLAASSPASGSLSLSVEEPHNRQSPPLQPFSADPGLSSSRMSSASDRGSKVSPSDIIRLADDKLDRQLAAAAASARRRFVLMTVGKTTRPARWRNPPDSAASEGETVGQQLELSPSSTSLRVVPEGTCVLRYSTSVDLTAPLDSDTRLAEQPFCGLLRSA